MLQFGGLWEIWSLWLMRLQRQSFWDPFAVSLPGPPSPHPRLGKWPHNVGTGKPRSSSLKRTEPAGEAVRCESNTFTWQQKQNGKREVLCFLAVTEEQVVYFQPLRGMSLAKASGRAHQMQGNPQGKVKHN